MRVAQAGTAADLHGVSSSVTVDLADLRSPFGSVHNRQKAAVAHRVALHVLSMAYLNQSGPAGPPTAQRYACINLGTQCAHDPAGPYSTATCDGKCGKGGQAAAAATALPAAPGSSTVVNTGPVVSSVAASHHNTEIVTVTIRTGVGGAGALRGSLDCSTCCAESAFEASVDGTGVYPDV
eukprot:SAG22_NODE_4121_length_1378_cov_1.222048_1_plen_179_part_10